MPPRKSTDFGALFAALVDDLRIQVAASVDRNFGELNKRLARLERRVDQFGSSLPSPESASSQRACALCDRRCIARGLCSAHYQQWRYRERKLRPRDAMRHPERVAAEVGVGGAGLLLSPSSQDISRDN